MVPREQTLRQGCVLALLSCFYIFFAEVVRAAYTRFKAEKSAMDALVSLKQKTGAGEKIAREPALVTSLWGTVVSVAQKVMP